MGWLVKKSNWLLAIQTLGRLTRLPKGLIYISLAVAGFSSNAANVSGTIGRVGDATHLEFSGLADWKYRLDPKSNTVVELYVPPFDEKTLVELQTWTDRFIAGIEIDKNAPDGQYKVTLKLKRSDVETFDYLTDEPSRLIVDIFEKPQVAETSKPVAPKVAKAKAPVRDRRRAKVAGDSKADDRKPSGELDPGVNEIDFKNRFINNDYPQRGVFDGGDPDYNRFRIAEKDVKESAIIASRQNIYIRFPMLTMPSSELGQLLDTRPNYVIKPRSSQENKEARLLLTLYKKGRIGLFFKAYNYFKSAYPDSVYDEIVTHLAAELQFDRFRKEGNRLSYDAAKSLYTYLLDKYPDSPLAERTNFILGYAALERGSAIPAIQRFERIINQYPNSESLDEAKRAQAAAFLGLNRYADALRTLNDLSKNAKFKRYSREASYRIGDVHFQKRDFDKAIKSYIDALENYPEYESTFPNAHFNMAESYFWKGDFRKALSHYVEFVSRFPNHDFGGYALTRIGENLGILGADQPRVIGAYLESYFRFRDNPGANVARVRMLSQQMKGMKEKELQKALTEISEIADNTDLPRIKEFVALMMADGFHRRKDYMQAMDKLISYYQKNPTSADLSFFKKKILAEMAMVMDKKVKGEEFIPALEFFQEYKQTWLRGSERLDIPYLLGRAYEQAGVLSEAGTIYKKTLADLDGLKGTERLKQIRVSEQLPSQDEINLRLARVSEQGRDYSGAEKFLKKIKQPTKLSSSSKIERVIISAEVAKAKGQTEKAKSLLSKLEESWKGQPELVAPVLMDLASLQHQDNEQIDAIQSIEKMEESRPEEGYPQPLDIEMLTTKGKVLEKQGKKLAAVEAYVNLLNQYEGKAPLGSVRYRAGDLLYKEGDLKGAELIWNKLSPEKDSMFLRLAEERLKDAEWQSTYKKYIERIPAMSGRKKE
ncbi:MAG: tetratricopeptide repeat protein [Bdellovibrionales bacterium]|nr:tetratricopeptide repeat protein [Bdellovibrionales bacterium]